MRVGEGRSEDELIIRKLLWLNHGCDVNALYGDDGEMCCNSCGLDFRRHDAKTIEHVLRVVEMRKLEKAAQG